MPVWNILEGVTAQSSGLWLIWQTQSAQHFWTQFGGIVSSCSSNGSLIISHLDRHSLLFQWLCSLWPGPTNYSTWPKICSPMPRPRPAEELYIGWGQKEQRAPTQALQKGPWPSLSHFSQYSDVLQRWHINLLHSKQPHWNRPQAHKQGEFDIVQYTRLISSSPHHVSGNHLHLHELKLFITSKPLNVSDPVRASPILSVGYPITTWCILIPYWLHEFYRSALQWQFSAPPLWRKILEDLLPKWSPWTHISPPLYGPRRNLLCHSVLQSTSTLV